MWRIVDIAEPDRMLSLSRQALTVSHAGQEIGRVPLRDIQAIMVHGHGTTLSLSLASTCAEAGIPLLLCNANHMPASLLLPVSGSFEQARRLGAQASAPLPLRKRLWRELVRAKITAQARSLEQAGHPDHTGLIKLTRNVRSGDPDNVEAQAARYYWQRLLGRNFRRDTDGNGLNAALNYGYAVIRAATARAVVTAGLSPALGLHHRSRLNAFQLVDDLMEPFRPLVDYLVWQNREIWQTGLTREAKAALAATPTFTMMTDKGASPVHRVMAQLCLSLAEVFLGERTRFWTPSDWAAIKQIELDLG